MKRRLLLLVALFFTVTLVACGSSEDTSNGDANANEETAEDTTANEAESSDENEQAD